VDGESGVLFQSEDPYALANAVLSLVQNDEKRKAIASAGKKRVEAHFSYTNYQQKITELYKAVTGSKQ
ncbi:MAG: glycosyltransferase, partial [Bacteroidales bacterium]|nr:glycosyltransferase [Bacteroidales bacterium]